MRKVNSAINVLKRDEKVYEETLKFLKNWWSNHILKEDMEYKKFINDNER